MVTAACKGSGPFYYLSHSQGCTRYKSILTLNSINHRLKSFLHEFRNDTWTNLPKEAPVNPSTSLSGRTELQILQDHVGEMH